MADKAAGLAVAGLVALAVAMGIGRFAFTPILPMMQSDAGLGVVQGGWLASANYLGYLVGALTAVAISAPPARVIAAALLGVALSTLAMGFTSSIAAWLALRALAGVASAWVLVFAASWSLEGFQRDAPPERRAHLGATVFAGVGVGIAVAGALCAMLIMGGATSSSAWIVLGLVALGASAAIRKAFAGGGHAVPHDTPPRLVVNAQSVRMILCYGAAGFGYIIPATFIATMARQVAPNPAAYSWSWPVFGAAAAASTFAAGQLRSHLSDRSLWIAGHVLMAAGVVTPLFLPVLAGIVLCALLVGGTFMVVTMAGIQEARRVGAAAARPLIAAMTASFAVGQILGPLVVSALAARGHDFTPALLGSGAVLLASAFALIPFRFPGRTP